MITLLADLMMMMMMMMAMTMNMRMATTLLTVYVTRSLDVLVTDVLSQ